MTTLGDLVFREALRAYVSGSSYGRVRKCPPSAVLPQVRHEGPDAVGNAIHEHLALRVSVGVDEAIAQLDAICLRWRLSANETGIVRARCVGFEWCPPKGAIAEVALCLMEDGTVQRITGGRGRYELPTGGLFPMTIDVMYSAPSPIEWDDAGQPYVPEGSELWVLDYKTGIEVNVDPVENNAQADAGAVIASIWTRAQRVVPGILFVRKGVGEWDVGTWLGPKQLAARQEEIRRTLARVAEQAALLARGEPLTGFTVGAWCDHCDAQSRCPAKTAALASLIGDVPKLGDAPLDEEQLRKLLTMAPQLERLAKAIKAAGRAHVEATGTPIDLHHGRAWGPHPHIEKVLVPEVAASVLAEDLGVEKARAAVRILLSRDAVKAAYRDAFPDETDKDIESRVRRFYGRCIDREALREDQATWWSAYRTGEITAGRAGSDDDDVDELPPPRRRKKSKALELLQIAPITAQTPPARRIAPRPAALPPHASPLAFAAAPPPPAAPSAASTPRPSGFTTGAPLGGSAAGRAPTSLGLVRGAPLGSRKPT